ncbi:RagB/SusD family nutrient uptake outer membrane protein [Pedobacter aquatilis]|uniref:RagB/SusD family nutrient uptake outer membrane protein n=1 Tax=Pedobacter aquatilis TaxID=351343 RepID=UPI0029305AEA|nr:RagB/SusD family nutrient uptake outer membrane protein [Pedobacter aquatilis]
MKTRILLAILLIAGLWLQGCKKYLDVKSDDKLVVPHTLDDVQALLDDATIMNIRTTPSFGEAMADDYFWLPATYSARPESDQKLYQWIPQEMNYGNDWSQAYRAIYNTNLSLELLDQIPVTTANQSQWNNAKGSALFFRSYYFLLLLGQYGFAYDEQTSDKDLGIVLRTGSDFNVPSVRATVHDCYEQINNDLKTSLSYLPDYPQHVMRPSKGAAYALLSRSYLYMRQYSETLKYAGEALKLNSTLMDYNNDASIISLTAAVPFRKYNQEIIFYAEMGTFTAFHITARAKIDSTLYASYATNDLRRTCFFKANSGYQQFKGSYAANANNFFTGLATDEQYLNRAEANAYLGNTSDAMIDLNYLMKKRWKNTITYSAITATDREDALKKVRTERRKELLMRNLRWMDVKRWNKEGAGIIMRRNINGKIVELLPGAAFYALPLPTDIVNLTGLQQN